MNPKELLREYYSRLVKEGWLKSLLFGFVLGFFALFLSAGLCWFFGAKAFWVCIVCFVVFAGASTPLFYYRLYRPTVKSVSRRIDALGLEERVVTMTDYDTDQSNMVLVQRKDAQAAMNTVNAKLIKFIISTSMIVAVCVCGFLGAGMTTVYSLSLSGKIPTGQEVFLDIITPEPQEYNISYDVDGDGVIEGSIFQIVKEGEDAEPVMAVPDDEFVFVGWSDQMDIEGLKPNPYRQDVNVKQDITVYAIFQPAGEGDGEGEGEGGEGDGEADSADLGEGEGNQSGNSNNPKPGEGAGGEYVMRNFVNDGETYYGGAVYENARKDAMDEMQSNDNYTQEDKEIGTAYFDTIER